MCDYRKFTPNTSYLRNFILSELKFQKFQSLIQKKNIFTTYRGELTYDNSEISFQRNLILKYLQTNDIKGVLTGNKVNRNKYLKELEKSKVILSPFGWGEICYRDFEAMHNASILIKPSMNHIYTFPDFFVENETYIPLSWDLIDLNEKVKDIDSNYSDYIVISKNAFDKFYYYQNSFAEFKSFFVGTLKNI